MKHLTQAIALGFQPMKNPFTQLKYAFEFWLAAVFGVYSQHFYEWNEWLFRDPRYTQGNLTGRFWQEINEGWDWMQPFMFEHLAEFNSYYNKSIPDTTTP